MTVPEPGEPSHCRRCCCDADVDICRLATLLGKGGSQVFKAAYLYEQYPVHVDLCFAVAIDHNFPLISASFHSIYV